MVSEIVTVTNKTGLHARPANAFIKVALAQPCAIKIKKNDKLFNGKSIVNVLAASVKCGEEIELIAEGENEQRALDAVVAAVKSGLGESAGV
ncbi:MAG: HPr family phosphocarrier protein [Peptococcaceae bacterium]|jgi:phosphocarrier protein|nr:HPr family phosphocarrier protein [Peptococcaceae bacterium]